MTELTLTAETEGLASTSCATGCIVVSTSNVTAAVALEAAAVALEAAAGEVSSSPEGINEPVKS